MAANTCSRTRPNRREAITASPTTPAERRVLGSAAAAAVTGGRFSLSPASRKRCSAALPVRRALLRERQRPFDEVLGLEEGGHRLVLPLAADGRLQAGLVQAAQHGLLGGADRHRAALADQVRPAAGGGQQVLLGGHL